VAFDWVRQLNEREGLSDEVVLEIQNSFSLSVRAMLSEDETEVRIDIHGAFPGWDVAPSTVAMAKQYGGLPEHPSAFPKPMRLRAIFTLETDFANDLASCLASMVKAQRLPKPSQTIADIEVVQEEKSGDTTFSIPGKIEFDPLDEGCFTVVVDLQTVADLLQVMDQKFIY
jgi:hypothetical protein